jgi:hypothetical protein
MSKQLECPHCGYKIDSHTAVGDLGLPAVDDLSVCINCTKWNKFDKDLNLVKFTEEDEKNSDPQLLVKLKSISDEILKVKNQQAN